MKRRMLKTLYVAAAMVACVVLTLALLGWFNRWQLHRARKEWKERAISEIRGYADDPAWVSREVSRLRTRDPADAKGVIAEGWLSDRMILMKSGEWLVYNSHCHEAPPHNVREICLAKGSDGKWYYTTCHFCVGMVALMMMQEEAAQPNFDDLRPSDLAFFAKRYHLREFDGRSDECLKETKTFPDQYYEPPANE